MYVAQEISEFTHQLELLFPYLLHLFTFPSYVFAYLKPSNINTTLLVAEITPLISLSYMIPFSSMSES